MGIQFSEHCVYTIVNADGLVQAFNTGKPQKFREAKQWVTGRELWKGAAAEKNCFPILFGDAMDCRNLEYWGILTSVELKKEGTIYSVDRIRKFPTIHKPQQLVLRSTGEHIKANFIRPYAICCTPSFLRDEVS